MERGESDAVTPGCGSLFRAIKSQPDKFTLSVKKKKKKKETIGNL